MEYRFDQNDLNEIQTIKNKYPEEKAAIMSVLWLSQKKFGWISPEVEALIAETLSLPLAHVHGVASFYTMYFKKEMGRKHVQVCTNVSCKLCGGDEIYEYAKTRLGIGNMEKTEDGDFSLEEVECMGACGGAPMVAVNEEFHERMDVEKFKNLMDNISR